MNCPLLAAAPEWDKSSDVSLERAGEIVRLARGPYQQPDAALDAQQSLAEAARLVPKGVI